MILFDSNLDLRNIYLYSRFHTFKRSDLFSFPIDKLMNSVLFHKSEHHVGASHLHIIDFLVLQVVNKFQMLTISPVATLGLNEAILFHLQ